MGSPGSGAGTNICSTARVALLPDGVKTALSLSARSATRSRGGPECLIGRKLERGEAPDRVADRPGEQQEHRRSAGHERDQEEALQAAVEQHGQPEGASAEEVRAPDQRLHAVDALEGLELA